jgi:pantothenate kinase-related protein Tda10
MTAQGGSPIEELKKAVIDQKKANLPQEPDDPALAGLHQAVVEYDQIVSQVVIALIQGWNSEVDQLQINQAQAAAAQALEAPDLQSNRRLAFYRKYKSRLDHMLELAKETRQKGGS